MEPFCRVFEGISRGGNKSSRRHQSCYQCLHPVRWYLVIVIGVWLAETAQTCSAETIVTIREGQNVTLNCTNQTLPASIHFTWSRQDGIPIPLQINQNSSVFFLLRVDRSFSSTYVCRYSANGATFNRSTQLIVQYPAEVKSVLPSGPHNVKPGSDISLSCIIDAVPVADRIIWLKHGTFYKESQNITVPSATCSDSGLYKCFPSNNLGTSINGSVNIAVQGRLGRITLHDNSSTSTSITLHWKLSTNGCLPVEYSIEWQVFNNKNARKENKSVGSSMSVTLTGLVPYESYLVCVRAVNNIGEGIENSSKQTTQIGVPSEPLSLVSTSLLCMIKVKWKKPAHINGPDELSYQVLYSEENSTYWNRTSNTKLTEFSLSCPHLREGSVYRIKVRANNSAGYGKDSNVTMATALGRMSSGDKDDIHDGYIVLAVLGSIAFVTAIIILVIYLRRKQQCRMSLRGFFNLDQPANPPLPKIQSFKDKRDREAVPYERFWNHVTYRHADTNYKFSSEFESLQGIQEKNKKLTWIHSQRPENQQKNRFANVVAYDQTRVVLSMVDDIQGSHYINANYVDSYNAMNFYIATQGPLANTIADFWRMVWEQNSRVIVMITKIIEKGRHKCAQYWPTKKRKTQDSGPIRVTLLREEHFAFFTLREFEVKPIREGTHYSQDSTDEAIKPMLVRQFHFTGWPDHGVPDPGYEIPVLDFIFRSTGAQVDGAGPIIVHCSAGVGRSGAFIVIDSMIKRIHDNGDLDIFNFLAHIRQQRNHLVQEECQYIFVHDVLLEYMQCGFLLSLPKRALKDHLNKIRTHVHSSGSLLISAEFERLNNIKIQDYNFKDGKKTCNVKKARNPVIIPVDTCRVKLYPRPSEEGSDYINASYIDGFWRREAYIATQYPLESTICDFWRMIWQENCRSVIMLLSNEELNKSIYPRYLPVVHDTARFGVYEVTMESESARGDLMIRDLRMTSLNEPGEVRKIRHFHFLHWPENSHPWSGQSVLQLVSKVDEWERDVRCNSKPFDMIGPIVVHCSTGVGRTGIYCILHTLWHQVGKEEVVSVFPTARLHFHQRPKLLQSQAQYEFCYDTMVEYIDADCSLYLV